VEEESGTAQDDLQATGGRRTTSGRLLLSSPLDLEDEARKQGVKPVTDLESLYANSWLDDDSDEDIEEIYRMRLKGCKLPEPE